MRRLLSAVHRVEQILTDIVDARLPMFIWLDFATIDLFKKHP